jgi:hypothetical protein
MKNLVPHRLTPRANGPLPSHTRSPQCGSK